MENIFINFIKDNYKKLKKIYPIGFLMKYKLLGLLTIITSSFVLFFAGYLFLWGYYFGGSGKLSLLSILVNYIPINRYVVILVGLFYFFVIVLLILIVLTIIKEISALFIFFVPLSISLINLALLLFFLGEINIINFFTIFKIYTFPVALVVCLISIYIINLYPFSAIKYILYFFLVFINIYTTMNIANIEGSDMLNSPEFVTLLLYIGLPIILVFKKNKNIYINKIIKVFAYLSCLLPLLPYLIYQIITTNIFLIIIISTILLIFFVYLLEYLLPKSMYSRIKDEPIKKSNQPMYVSHPIMSLFFLFTVAFISIVTIPSVLVNGGSYFQEMTNKVDYQQIIYKWNEKEENIIGNLVSREDNTYFISTKERKLLVIKADEIIISPIN